MTKDQEEVFSLYSELRRDMPAVSLNDLDAAKTWVEVSEACRHSSTLLAYGTALRFLVQHVAMLPSLPQHLPLLKSLSSSLATDAFSACLRNRSLTSAVELLEQGRGVFWSQLSRLRSPLDDVIACGPEGPRLAEEYNRLASTIRNTLGLTGENVHDRVWRLNVDLERTVSHIRQLPGLSCFLLPPLFADLRQAAADGPVIIVNASRYGCDALIVSKDKGPVRVPLSGTKQNVEGLTAELRALTARSKKEDITKDLSIYLRALWDQIVSPIADCLQSIVEHPLRSRVWWCPTSDFSPLPLHAANPYRKGQKGFSALYISSYTPTLSALLRARSAQSCLAPEHEQKRFVAIGQANAAGARELHTIGAELESIEHLLSDRTTFTRIEGQEASTSRVTDELSKNTWVHLACHGIPNRKEPFASGFGLHDGRLTVQHVSRTQLQNPEFAYLSACHTMAGDRESPDEVIHLAAAVHFAGFPSVIGTMWAVDDGQAGKVSSAFYGHMLADGRLDHTQAAHALWKTMKTVKDVTLDQRILYVHLGV